MTLTPAAERLRRRLIGRGLPFYLWVKLPLAAFAGLRIVTFDEQRCVVRLPGGWRTQNPFRSTYFAAQCMAAELSTGAPASVLVEGAPVSIAMLVRGFEAEFMKKAQGVTLFSCEDVPGLAAAIESAAASDAAQEHRARSVGRTLDGTIVSELSVLWSFKRRTPR